MNEPFALPDELSVEDLYAYLVGRYHNFAFRELPRLARLARVVAAQHGESDTRLVILVQTVDNLYDSFATQIECAERRLPSGGGSSTIPGQATPGLKLPSGTAFGPDARNELEAIVREIHNLTDEFIAPPWACPAHRRLVDALSAAVLEVRRILQIASRSVDLET